MGDLLFMLVPQPQRKPDQPRRVSTARKTRHGSYTSQSAMARMRSTSPPRKIVKTNGGHEIAEFIQGIVEEVMKKIREENTGLTPLNKAIKLLGSRYGSHKNLLSNGLKLMGDDRNVGTYLALDRDSKNR